MLRPAPELSPVPVGMRPSVASGHDDQAPAGGGVEPPAVLIRSLGESRERRSLLLALAGLQGGVDARGGAVLQLVGIAAAEAEGHTELVGTRLAVDLACLAVEPAGGHVPVVEVQVCVARAVRVERLDGKLPADLGSTGLPAA